MIAVLGECVADAFVADEAGEPREGLTLRVLPGGGPANTAVALARLGTRARFLGRVSDDVFGRLFRRRLEAAGVDLAAVVAAPQRSTLGVLALDEDGRATFSFHDEGAADWQWTGAELTPDRLGNAACLHTGSMALVREPGAAEVARFAAACAPRATISIDPNVRPGLATRQAYLDRLPASADILKLSDDDLDFLLPGTPPEAACDHWHGQGVRLVVVTRGAAGALVSLAGERSEVPGLRVEVADTVGAGDAFTAGLLHHLDAAGHLGGRLDRLDMETARAAAVFANRVAALTCTVPGADPPALEAVSR
ncbi:carbohydrate kinase family protein [Nonomuraea typhae]|uniref:carbohydrate kinase family protein n=1 Tax=Nonomuraea typhae TaxID=2603600 RepID=UPI0012FB86C7|nr:carbohydrate kinase [Nonomuraea typhae]